MQAADQIQPETAPRSRRNHPGLFKKGQSGNPGGRAKTPPDVRLIAQQMTVEAMQVLGQAMRAGRAPWPTKVRAAEIILERGHGRAAITVDQGAAEALAAGSISLLAALQSMSSPQPVVSAPLIDVTPGDTDKPSD